jgi:hypothetical protein
MKNTELILAIVVAVITYGPRAVLAIAEILQLKENATAADIEALYITQKPEDYFKS